MSENRFLSSARSMAVGAGADDLHSRLFQAHREGQGCLPAELHDHAVGLLPVHDGKHVLARQRLEVQLVGGIVVGGDGLGIRVDHDRLVADLAQGECGVHAAVVELDALADTVRPASEDHDLAACIGPRLVFAIVGGIVVGRGCLELRRAGVHQLVAGLDSLACPQRPHCLFVDAQPQADLDVAEAHLLCREKVALADRRLEIHDLLDVGEEPGIDARRLGELLHGPRRGAAPRRCRKAARRSAARAFPAASIRWRFPCPSARAA